MDINAFSKDIRDLLIDNIPVESDENFLKKHIKRGKKLFQAVAVDSSSQLIPVGLNGYAFELGSPSLEQNFPHYHILEDAYTIKKRGKGTAQSKGSQDKISNKSHRDYSAWSVKENTKYAVVQSTGEVYQVKTRSVYQEYRKNVRGNRKPKEKFKQVYDRNTGNYMNVNVSTSYVNKHYHYIEKAFDLGLPFIAQKYNMRMGRTSISDEEKEEALKSFTL